MAIRCGWRWKSDNAEKPQFALTTITTTIEESDDPGVEVVVDSAEKPQNQSKTAEKPQFVVDPEVWRTFKEISITRTPYIK